MPHGVPWRPMASLFARLVREEYWDKQQAAAEPAEAEAEAGAPEAEEAAAEAAEEPAAEEGEAPEAPPKEVE